MVASIEPNLLTTEISI